MATRSRQDTQRAKPTAEEPIANRGVHGEGNYRASREYDGATELERAEQCGKSRAKGEDPELRPGGTKR